MRIVVFGVIGLLVGLGGGIGYSFTLGREPSVADGGVTADSLTVPAADSLHGDGTEGPDEGHPEAADSASLGPDSTEAQAPESPTDSVSRRIASALIRTPPPDSTTGREPAPQGATGEAARPDSSGTPGDSTGAVQPAPDSTSLATGLSGPAAAGAPATGELSEEETAGYRRVSRILAAMDAKEAAEVMSGLQDEEVRQLLGFLPARTAAAILAELDPARVARLSRGMFNPTR